VVFLEKAICCSHFTLGGVSSVGLAGQGDAVRPVNFGTDILHRVVRVDNLFHIQGRKMMAVGWI
jgi:hypothetical protein